MCRIVFIKVVLFILFQNLLSANVISINTNTNELNITPNLETYMDQDRNKNIDDIKSFNKEFKKHDRGFLDFGYIVSSAVWLKVTFENDTEKNIEKVLAYSDVLVSKYFLYSEDGELLGQQGVHMRPPTLKNLRNYFFINIPSNSKKTYFIYLSTELSSTHGMFQIYDEEDFFQEEALHIIILSCFFSAIFILSLYNLFLFFFSKDIVYFYYSMYLFILAFQQSITVGFLYTFITVETRWYYENWLFTMIIVNLLYMAIIPFTKRFLDTYQYPKINFILNLYFWVILFSIPIFYFSNSFVFYDWIVGFLYTEMFFLIFIGWYALFKGNFNARYFVIGWGLFVLLALATMTLHFLGVYPFLYKFPYFAEIMFLSEAVLFSVALAHKLKRLQNDLITQQQTEQIRLQKEVDIKTSHLNNLLKELHHRVKNNMQIIISMIRLQYKSINEVKIKEKFIEIENRIDAMSKVHALLYTDSVLDNSNIKYYFETLIENIQSSFIYEHEIDVDIQGECNFDMDKAIYLGLIINELVYNSMKYAFDEEQIGAISILLKKEEDRFLLMVKDNGKGINKEENKNSLGLKLVNVLVTEQINGDINFTSKNGTEVKVYFE